MLKKRIIATLIVKNGIVVQSIGFNKYLPVGKPEIAVDFLNQWGIDEIILLDISATRDHRRPDSELISRAAKKCFVPLTVGGGITTIEDVNFLMHNGADKVSLNQVVFHNRALINQVAGIFGQQAVVVSIDFIKNDSQYCVYDYLNKKALPIDPVTYAKEIELSGAGEIFINSVDRDGSYKGYDLKLISKICEAVSIPVICCGGAKNANDMTEVLSSSKVCGAAAANFFHFTEHSVNITKAVINKEVQLRIETHANYSNSIYDENMRLTKKSDQELETLLYTKIKKEVI